MNHPFDDFLPPSWHQDRSDQRVVRVGAILVAVVSISTAAAFASTMGSWRSLLKDRAGVGVLWDDAQLRVDAYLQSQQDLSESIESAKNIDQYTDGIPRSMLLWELTQNLPDNTRIDDVRLETRRRLNDDDEVEISELITLIGIAPSDAAISKYIADLSTVHIFSSVSLMYAQQYHKGDKRTFSIQMEVRRDAILVTEFTQ
jgi:Tfp pilus assembly protein PilN